MTMADRSHGLLCKVSWGSGTPYVNNGIAGEWQWRTDHIASSAKWVAEAKYHMCVNNGIAGEWQWQTGHAASFTLRKRNAICVFITEVQVADSTGSSEWGERSESAMKSFKVWHLCVKTHAGKGTNWKRRKRAGANGKRAEGHGRHMKQNANGVGILLVY